MKCDKCGQPANHKNSVIGQTAWQYLCCRCWVKDGNPPADWHNACMAYSAERALGRYWLLFVGAAVLAALVLWLLFMAM